MDVRQKHIVPLDGRQSDFAEKDDASADGREDNEKQSSSPTLLMDDTPDFVATAQTARPSASIPYINRDREAMTFVRWQLPSRMPREVMNFDCTMVELMEQERFPAMDNSTPRYHYHAKNIAAIEAIQVLVRQRSPASRHGSETLPRVNSDHDQGAVGTMPKQGKFHHVGMRMVEPEERMISLITIDYFPLSLGLEELNPRSLMEAVGVVT